MIQTLRSHDLNGVRTCRIPRPRSRRSKLAPTRLSRIKNRGGARSQARHSTICCVIPQLLNANCSITTAFFLPSAKLSTTSLTRFSASEMLCRAASIVRCLLRANSSTIVRGRMSDTCPFLTKVSRASKRSRSWYFFARSIHTHVSMRSLNISPVPRHCTAPADNTCQGWPATLPSAVSTPAAAAAKLTLQVAVPDWCGELATRS